MDRDQDQERDKEQDRMWAATRLTEAAVSQLFQGASTPMDVSRGQQIGQIVAELYSTIYTGKDVQSTLDVRPSLSERMANAPARSPVLPRPTRVGQRGPAPRPIASSIAPAVGKDAGSAAGAGNLPRSIQNESAEEAPRQHSEAGPSDVQERTEPLAGIPEIGPNLGTPPENPENSLQSLLSEIGADAPQEEAPEERRLPPAEPFFHPEKLPPASLESQLASIASQGPLEPEIPPSPQASSFPPAPSAPPAPRPNPVSSRAPSPAPAKSEVVVLETSEKRRPKWKFWKG